MMLFLRRIRALIIKELQGLFGDSQSRRILILPLVVQLTIFPLAATLEVKNNNLAIFNEDQGANSIELTHRLSQAAAFTKVIFLHSHTEVHKTIEHQKALAVVWFPNDFSRKVEAGKTTSLQVLLDGRRSNSSQIAFNYIQEIIQNFSKEQSNDSIQTTSSSILIRHRYNPNLDYTYFILPCLIAIILTVTTIIVTSLSVAREREHGTFDQLLVSPLTPEMIMIGKAIPALLISLVQATIILLAAIIIYQIPFEGSVILFYVSACFYVFALVGFGLFISSICTTQQQAFLGAFCFITPAILLSGFTAPVENMPPWIQIITWVNPLRHFIPIVKGIFLKDASFAFVAQSTLPLLLITLITLIFTIFIFRRRFG